MDTKSLTKEADCCGSSACATVPMRKPAGAARRYRIATLRQHGGTGRPTAGRVCVTGVDAALPIA